MKVRLIGFSLELGEGIVLEEFEDFLGTLPELPFAWRAHKRMFRCRKHGEHFEGIFLTIKDQRTFPVLKKALDYEVSVHELNAGEQLIDFNHFVWSRKTGRGLYQHYHQSPALSQFGGLLEDTYEKLRKKKIDEAVAKAGATEAARRKYRKQFKGGLCVAQIVSPLKLKELLSGLDTVDRFQVDFTSFLPDQGTMFDPLKKAVKRQRFSLLFDPEWRSSTWLKNAIGTWAANRNLKRGFVEGREGSNPKKRVDFERNYDFYGEFELEEITKGIAGSLSKWDSSAVLALMRDAMSDHADTFLIPEE